MVFGADEPFEGALESHLPRILRPHARLLAGMGAPACVLHRLAGRDHPRRYHAQAVQFRGDRRDRRRAHHLDPGGAGVGAHLGLSLLLDARRLFRRARAQPHRRDAHDGGFHLLHSQHRRRPRRALRPLYGVVPPIRSRSARAEALAGYGGDGPVRIGNAAARQDQHDVYGSIIMAATPMFFDRRLPRPGDAALFHADRAARRAGGAGWRWSRMPAFGNIAAASACIRIRRRCAGPAASGWRRSPPISDLTDRAQYWGEIADANRRGGAQTRLESQAQRLFRRFRRRRSRRQRTAFGRTRADRARRPAFCLHGGRDRA